MVEPTDGVEAAPVRRARDTLSLYAVAAAVTVVVLAPLAAPGYALLYDMVFVPRQPLTWDLVAPAQSLPRAVPMDALVSLVTQLVPGWVVQRLALAGAVFLAAVGAGRLVPTERRAVRLFAAVAYAWTPYLAERLLIGQWGLLLAYAALPWLVRAALDLRAGRDGALARVVLAAAPAAITPTGGLIALGTVLVLTSDRMLAPRSLLVSQRMHPHRSRQALAAVGVLNAPWVVAALVTGAGGSSDPAGVAAFAARSENWAGPLVALAGTGGIWSAQATPSSRAAPLVPVAALVLLILAGVGAGLLRRRLPPGGAARLAVLAGTGFLLAAFGLLPGGDAALRWAVVHLPGAGLLRDGQKFLAPYALLLVVCAALGAERLVARIDREVAGVVLVGLLFLPVAVLPDLAFGGAGRLRPVSYPTEWQRVAEHIEEEPGEILALPLSAYRAYQWNPGRVVLDPAPRYLPGTVLTDDTLRVGDVAVAGENPRVREMRRALAEGRPVWTTGVRWVLVQREVSGEVDSQVLGGLERVHDGPFLTLYRNPATVRESGGSGPARLAVVAALSAALLVVIAAAVSALHRRATAW
ncbi:MULTISPECIES: DUF3367 domain-containing protein [Micromonospora]|uniref:DUF3367 domain-containing protein n=1 Tax=Micromonospora TaxID=1873 RepID=UPI001EE7838C|nr:DUF3367 domain-containing protein [Micromonospora hortensis]MCG5450418.1 DUF3367 domain-containing protein [Micromonospora hortensis]WTI08117.1 DUF3367 domain-containing protein [Micromonospora sp. NBC_00821]